MSDNAERSCSDCVSALFEDYGYSNYTCEGTDFSCKLGLHPDGEFDRFYGTDQRLLYAKRCAGFTQGQAEEHDVDCPYDCRCHGTAFDRRGADR